MKGRTAWRAGERGGVEEEGYHATADTNISAQGAPRDRERERARERDKIERVCALKIKQPEDGVPRAWESQPAECGSASEWGSA